MKKVIKAPIIFSLLAASAFSIIGQEPARANKLIKIDGACKLMEMDNANKDGVVKYKVKDKKTGELLWSSKLWRGKMLGKLWMKSSYKC